jgi:hypothetical protein
MLERFDTARRENDRSVVRWTDAAGHPFGRSVVAARVPLVRGDQPLMKVIAVVLSSAVLVGTVSISAAAGAQQPEKAASPRTLTVKTADYTEQVAAGGDQVVKFTGDELSGPANGIFGDRVRVPPGAVRVGLIRPRLNFVPELLKTVENL